MPITTLAPTTSRSASITVASQMHQTFAPNKRTNAVQHQQQTNHSAPLKQQPAVPVPAPPLLLAFPRPHHRLILLPRQSAQQLQETMVLLIRLLLHQLLLPNALVTAVVTTTVVQEEILVLPAMEVTLEILETLVARPLPLLLPVLQLLSSPLEWHLLCY